MGFPNIDGLAFLFTVPVGVIFGLMAALTLVIIMGPTWWVLLPIVSGFLFGIWWGYYIIG